MHMLGKLKSVGNSVAKQAKSGAAKARSKATKNEDQYIVALDIGTEFVKALIAKVNAEDSTVEIVGVGRAHQALSDMQAGAIADIAGVVDNCDKALNQAEDQARVSVRTAIIGIAGELVKGTTTTVRVARKDVTKPLDIVEME